LRRRFLSDQDSNLAGKSGLDHFGFDAKDAVGECRRLSKRHMVAAAPFREGKWMPAYVTIRLATGQNSGRD
jgi:hypothetical protein